MKYQINMTGRTLTVDFLLEDRKLLIRSDLGELHFEAIQIHKGVYSILMDHRSFVVGINTSDNQYVTVNGVPVFLELLDAVHLHLKELGWDSLQEIKAGLVSAQIPGLVTRIFHQVGDHVSEGEPIFLIEAMKMENEIKSPIGGIVQQISVEEGQTVEKGTNIIHIG